MTTIGWIVSVAAFVVAAVIFFLLGIRYRKSVAEREISSAEEEATASSTKPSRVPKIKREKHFLKPKKRF